MKVAALGRTGWLYDSILALHQAGNEIVLIGTAVGAPEYKVQAEDFESLARKLGCSYFCDPRIGHPHIRDQLRDCGAEVAISVNWPTLIGRFALEAFPHGILNLHAGDLPRFRGNACPNWAMLSGEREVVVSVHQMADELDAGAIWCQRAIPLHDQTYIADVYRFIAESAPGMFLEAVEKVGAGAECREQSKNSADALRCYPRQPTDGLIDWTQPAEQVCALVRASAEPFAGAYTYLEEDPLVIWKARADRLPSPSLGVPGQVVDIHRDTGEVVVLTGDGVLVIEEICYGSSERIPPAEVVRSTRTRLGLSLTSVVTAMRGQIKQLNSKLRELELKQSSMRRLNEAI